MMDRHRAFPRVKPKEVLLVDFTNYLGRVRDLSPNGAFIEDGHPYSLGKTVSFRLWLRSDNSVDLIPIKATVRWVEERRGIGVQFECARVSVFEPLREYCASASY